MCSPVGGKDMHPFPEFELNFTSCPIWSYVSPDTEVGFILEEDKNIHKNVH